MDHNLKEIETYKQAHRAQLLKVNLEEAGIECFLSEETVLGSVEGVKVQVDEPNYEKAYKIYKELEAELEKE